MRCVFSGKIDCVKFIAHHTHFIAQTEAFVAHLTRFIAQSKAFIAQTGLISKSTY
jgi:hypothetical protein